MKEILELTKCTRDYTNVVYCLSYKLATETSPSSPPIHKYIKNGSKIKAMFMITRDHFKTIDCFYHARQRSTCLCDCNKLPCKKIQNLLVRFLDSELDKGNEFDFNVE